jgi:hypothetical protein
MHFLQIMFEDHLPKIKRMEVLVTCDILHVIWSPVLKLMYNLCRKPRFTITNEFDITLYIILFFTALFRNIFGLKVYFKRMCKFSCKVLVLDFYQNYENLSTDFFEISPLSSLIKYVCRFAD